MKKRILALTLAVMMVVGLCACEEEKLTPEEMLTAVSENMQELDSYSFQMNMDMKMTAGGIEVPMTMAMDCDLTQKPYLFHGNAKVSLAEMGSMEMEMYGQMEEGAENMDMFMNMNVMGTQTGWKKQSSPVGAAGSMDPAKTMIVFTDLVEAEEKEEVDGVELTVYQATLSGDKMLELMNSMGQTQAMNMPQETLDMMKGMELPVTYKVDTDEQLLVAMEMDMAAMMENMPSDMGGGVEMKVDKMVMSFTFSNFDGVDEITIPQEVLDAPAA